MLYLVLKDSFKEECLRFVLLSCFLISLIVIRSGGRNNKYQPYKVDFMIARQEVAGMLNVPHINYLSFQIVFHSFMNAKLAHRPFIQH